MKEATGELNMTVVTVVAIAAVAAFFYAFVWPNIKSSIQAGTYCAQAVCTDTAMSDCTAYDSEGTEVWSGSCKQYYEKQADGGEVPAGYINILK